MTITLQLDPAKINSIHFHWDRWPTNRFALWIPEVWIFANDDDRLWIEEPAGWRGDGGALACDWIDGRQGDCAIQWRIALEAGTERVGMTLRVRNTGREPLPALTHMNSCLNFIGAPDFMDSTGDFSLFRAGGEWRAMRSLRRAQSLGLGHDAYHILARGFDDPGDAALIQATRAESGLFVREGRTGRAFVGVAWEAPVRLDVNYNALQCIHSTPGAGGLAPGGELERRGAIYFHEGDREDLLERCRQDGLL
jgi:hypothetical protein